MQKAKLFDIPKKLSFFEDYKEASGMTKMWKPTSSDVGDINIFDHNNYIVRSINLTKATQGILI